MTPHPAHRIGHACDHDTPAAKLREYLSRSQEAHDTTRRELSRSIDEHRNNWLREVAGLQIERDALQEKIETVRADLAPLLAYLQSGWLGPVHGSYQRLKAFVEGK